MFTRDLSDPVRIGSAIWYQMGPLMKVIHMEPHVPVSNWSRVNRVVHTIVDPILNISDPV